MAYNDSGEIAWGSGYNLGEYSFSLERTSVPGSTSDQITAVCRQGDKSARKSIQIPSSSQIEGWYVEANETEASVYAVIKGKKVPIGDFNYTSGSSFSQSHQYPYDERTAYVTSILSATSDIYVAGFLDGNSEQFVFASKSPFVVNEDSITRIGTQTFNNNYTYTGTQSSYDGQSFYYAVKADFISGSYNYSTSFPNNPKPANYSAQLAAAKMVLGDESKNESKLVGRFAIDIGDAGGYPGGGDWDEPGDYDPEWDPEDPTTTLYVDVTGALSGRHNDPLNDTSYSYLPSDKDTVKQYGSGGDGGHGGGGGAGASTVLVHRIATNKANSHEVIALARRHGYGSGGGKGGRGGDGIILIYY